MLLRLLTYQRLWVLFAGCVLLAVTDVVPAWGQFSRVQGVEELQVGQNTNLFAHWEGRTALDGVFVEMPSGWKLSRAFALYHGYERVALQIERMNPNDNIYVVSAPHELQGAYDFVFQAQTGGLSGRASWSVVPFTSRSDKGHVRLIPRESYRVIQALRQVEPLQAVDNQVLSFQDNGTPWLLRRDALPHLDTRSSYTVEFWMRTTNLQEVVLSTWNGEERSEYPLELIVDAAGRLRYYRGQPEQHASMATQDPVADGQWHHVALTHDPDAGWTRLYLDGVAADSLYSPVMPDIAQRSALALGGRVPSQKDVETMKGYSGLLDELRFWAHARRVSEIRNMMRQPLDSWGDALVMLSFEEEIPEQLVAQRASRTRRVYSDLSFYHPVRDVQAVVKDNGVMLTWETNDVHTASFFVERSTDEHTFKTIGEVTVSEGDRVGTEGGGRFEFYDTDVSTQVMFYRIRQHFEGGTDRLSGTIKVGLGQEEAETAVLVGNFPNPFNPNTTIVYEVREPQRIRISVWDLSGQRVTVLVDREHQSGNFEVAFDGSDLPSGTYFVRLQSSYGPMQTHKMILMK